MKLDYTFHSHTYRCKHANGDIEDYVIKAIENGFKTYGVSDHVFLPGDPTPWMRGSFTCLDNYIETYNKVKAKYKDQIDMYLGFECEYGDIYLDYYRYLLKERGFDYLICGQHNGFRDDGTPYFLSDTNEGLYQYRDNIIKAIKSGLFLYIAHPDLFFAVVTKITPTVEQVTKDIIDVAIKYDVALEVNVKGLLRNKIRDGVEYIEYPAKYFWKVASKTKVKIVYGGDFHDPSEIGDEHLLNLFNNFVEECGITFSNIHEIYKNYKKLI